jgi:RNA polymerase Rpb1, domain 2
MAGVDVFLRREIFGRRLTRSARAVIIPAPELRIDQIGLPKCVADTIFQGLLDGQRQIVLVNRNPTLQRRGLLALRPVIYSSEAPVFRLPLGVLKTLAADFDGDQASVVALEKEESLREAEQLLLPGCENLRVDPFRDGEPAFPLVKELSCRKAESDLAINGELLQEDWCAKHAELIDKRIKALGDGWAPPYSAPDFIHALREQMANEKDGQKRLEALKLQVLWNPEDAKAWSELGTALKQLEPHAPQVGDWRDLADLEMRTVYNSVRTKGRYGGVLRRQLFCRAFGDQHTFRRSIEALHAITEPLVQSALSCKSVKSFTFPVQAFFRDPERHKAALQNIDPKKDEMGRTIGSCFNEEKLRKALGKSVEPTGLLAWFAKPTFESLLRIITKGDSSEEIAPPEDPRTAWYV